MTVTLELKPEAEAVARAEAQAQGMAIEPYLQTVLESALPHSAQEPETIRRQRMEILCRLQGKYAGLSSSDEFAAQKSEEKAREERNWKGKV